MEDSTKTKEGKEPTSLDCEVINSKIEYESKNSNTITRSPPPIKRFKSDSNVEENNIIPEHETKAKQQNSKLSNDEESPVKIRSKIEDIKEIIAPQANDNYKDNDNGSGNVNDDKGNDHKTYNDQDKNDSINKNDIKTRVSPQEEKSTLNTDIKQQHRFKRIPIFIVDYHNEVLEFIYRCIGSRHLLPENNILVHFDSHPDLVISHDIKASTSHEKETLLGDLSIENWIMPMCYAGYIHRVVWLKNSWCQQIPVGKYNFDIGQKDDKISVNCPLEYFISEGNYCDSSDLMDSHPMELQVHNVDVTNIDPKDIVKQEDGPRFILDIDLDFFSVSNPFLEIYKNVNCYQQLTEIFHFDNSRDSGLSTERRKQQLQALRHIFIHLEEVRTLEGLETPDLSVISAETFTRIQKLVETLKKNYEEEEIDWLLIYDSGSTTDTNGLPHHISTKDELDEYFEQFKQFLQHLPIKPVIITIARSAEDDYCPSQQVDFIEKEVLRILYEVFQNDLHDTPIKQYMDEEWDVWNL